MGTILALAASALATSASAARALSEEHAWRVLPAGDSITEGGSTFQNWRLRLWERLTAEGYVIDYVGSRSSPSRIGPLAHEGHGGKNVEFLAARFKEIASRHPADVLLLHAGHNHFAEEQPIPSMLEATESIILSARAANPRVIILLAQVIPSAKLPKYSYIPEFNRALAPLATKLTTVESPVVLVDQESGFDPIADTVADKVHPNESGAQKIADRWFDALVKVLPRPKRAPLEQSSP